MVSAGLRGAISTRLFIFLLLAALAFPGLLFGLYLLTNYSASEQQRYGREAMRLSSLISRVVDGELESLLGELRGLSSSGRLREGDFAGFYEEARQLVGTRPAVVLLRDLQTTQLVNTQVPLGQSLPPAPELADDQRRAIEAGQPIIGSVYTSPISGEFRVPVAVPIDIGADRHILAMTVPTTYLRDVLVSVVPEGWTVSIGDTEGVIVSRSRGHEEFTGKPGLAEYLRQATGTAGTFRALGFDGVELVAGYQRSPKSGWLYAANIPTSIIAAPSWDALRGFLIVGVAAILLSGAMALLFGQRLAAGTRRLVERARELGADTKDAQAPRTGIEEFDRIGAALQEAGARRLRAEEMLRARSQELEVILDTVPAAVWFTHGKGVEVVQRNRFAAELMRIPNDDTSAIASGSPAVSHVKVLRSDGEECAPAELPLQRALRGEEVDDDEYVFRFNDGTERILLTSARPLRDGNGNATGAVSVSVDITDRHRAEEQRRLLTNELNHRVKNALATFQSMAIQTLRGAPSLKVAEQSLTLRLSALAAAHTMLTRQNWEGAELDGLIDAVLRQPHTIPAGRLVVRGRKVWLPPSLALSITLALHELLTNAIKHGALSADTGSVNLQWEVRSSSAGQSLVLDWTEQNGPPVQHDGRQGFGTRLLRSLFRGDDGRVELEYEPSGLRCRIEVPLAVQRAGGSIVEVEPA